MCFRGAEQKSREKLQAELRDAGRQLELVEQEIIRRANKSIESQQRGKVEINKLRMKLEERKRENRRLSEVVQNYKAMLEPLPFGLQK
jgi:septal ring factor EnvC (AmiA/AmiB activator)